LRQLYRRPKADSVTTEVASAAAPARPLVESLGVATRVDAPHVFPSASPPAIDESPCQSPPPATGDSALAAELCTQATQLSGYFDARQAELDAREAELNARIARLETESRRARIWLDERRAELNQDQSRLGHRADAERRLDRIVAAESLRQKYEQQRHSDVTMVRRLMRNVERHRQSLEDRQTTIAPGAAIPAPAVDKDARREIARLKTQLAAAERRAADLVGELAKERANRAAAANAKPLNDDRSGYFAELEAKLNQEAEQLKVERELLAAQRDKWRAERETAEAEMARQQTIQETELARRRQAIDREQAALATRQSTLDRLRDDLQATQRELCELRLATEETWVQLTGRAPPARLTLAMAEVRRRLADQYSGEAAQLDGQRRELESLREVISGQLSRLKEDRRQFQKWAQRRQSDVEKQAARLVAREQQLDAQETKFQDAALRWRDEQRGYQRQIRRLLAQLGQHATASVD
jgi:hypothetical protein